MCVCVWEREREREREREGERGRIKLRIEGENKELTSKCDKVNKKPKRALFLHYLWCTKLSQNQSKLGVTTGAVPIPKKVPPWFGTTQFQVGVPRGTSQRVAQWLVLTTIFNLYKDSWLLLICNHSHIPIFGDPFLTLSFS